MVSSRLLVTLVAVAVSVVLVQPTLAAGDVVAGKKVFKQCRVCHSLDPAHKRLGPTLKGIIGRTAASIEGYSYSDSYIEAREKGLVWTEEEIVEYLADPTRYLAAYLGIEKARSKMAVTFKELADRENVVAYLKEAAE